MRSMTPSRIVGTGSYLPERLVNNEEVASFLGLRNEDIFRLTGIKSRYWCSPEQTCSDLGEQAAQRALVSAGLSIESVDAIFVSTTSPDNILPSTACHLQHRLQAKTVPAFDLAASCTGFLYGLSTANAFIQSGQARCCLVVAAEVKSRYLSSTQKPSAMLFGDGAGAAVVMEGTPSQNVGTKTTSGFLSIRLHSDGRCHDFIKVPAGGSKFPSNIDTVRNDLHAIGLKGGAVFRAGVKRLSSAYSETLSEYGLTIQDIAQVIAHQANARMLKAIAKRAGVPSDKMFSMIEQVGNTSSASLPIALDVAHRQKKFGRGDLILLGAFGGGLTWGTALIRW